jgi:hypothetical protein
MGWPTDKGRIRLDKQQSVATARPAGSLWLVPLDLPSFFRRRILLWPLAMHEQFPRGGRGELRA